jgi:hypothetical protein
MLRATFFLLGFAALAGGQSIDASLRYLGQTPPGLTPVRFAPGIVSTSAIEINAAFRPDFREFFFARGGWSVHALPFDGRRQPLE